MSVTMVPVKSSVIKAVGYEPETQTLHVHFTTGGQYQFSNVPPQKHKALMAADSVGKHFSAHIRPNHQFKKY